MDDDLCKYVHEFGSAIPTDPLQFLFIKSEWLMLKRLYKQIINIRQKNRSTSRRSCMLRKYFVRTSFLLEKNTNEKIVLFGTASEVP